MPIDVVPANALTPNNAMLMKQQVSLNPKQARRKGGFFIAPKGNGGNRG